MTRVQTRFGKPFLMMASLMINRGHELATNLTSCCRVPVGHFGQFCLTDAISSHVPISPVQGYHRIQSLRHVPAAGVRTSAQWTQETEMYIIDAKFCCRPPLRDNRDGHLLFEIEMYLQKGCIMVSGVESC